MRRVTRKVRAMKDNLRLINNDRKLQELDEQTRAIVKLVLFDLACKGYKPRINEAYRSPEDQERKFKQGLSKIKSGGKHQQRRAADIIDDRYGWGYECPQEFWLYLASSALARGLKPGLFFGLGVIEKLKLKRAIQSHDFEKAKTLKWGWDCAHVER